MAMDDADPTRIIKRSVTIAGHRTSVSLEEGFWRALRAAAAEDGVAVNELVRRIDAGRRGNLSSALRVYVLERISAKRADG